MDCEELPSASGGGEALYRGMLGKGFESLDQIKARDRETLPKVLTPEEVAHVLSEVPLLRYRDCY